MGKNVALNRNSGRVMTNTRSKSCQVRTNVVAAVPRPAAANPMSTDAGTASSASGVEARPSRSITTMNPMA